MAYSVIKAGDCGDSSIGYYYEYLCESDADIANLPTTAAGGGPRPGSLAYIESDSSARYILKINREWGEYPMASGGGGGNSGDVLTIKVSELATPSADGTESNYVHGADGLIDAVTSYVYPGTFADLGDLSSIKAIWIVPDEPGYEGALWGVIIAYGEDGAADPAEVSEGELALTATTPFVIVETHGGSYGLLPTGTVFAPGTGR